jgi:uncharacterized membrane protein YqaE (UPF0057 family)
MGWQDIFVPLNPTKMKNTLLFTAIIAVISLMSSCTVEKRRYLDGYHIDWKGRQAKVENAETSPSQMAEMIPAETAMDETSQNETLSPVFTAPAVTETPAEVSAVVKTVDLSAGTEVSKPGKMNTPSLNKIRGALRSSEAKNLYPSARATFADADGGGSLDNTPLLVIIAFFIPFLAVFLYEEEWNGTCWLNLLLTLLFWLPGFIHALIVILG